MTATFGPTVEWFVVPSSEPIWCDRALCGGTEHATTHRSTPVAVETESASVVLSLQQVDSVRLLPETGEPTLQMGVMTARGQTVIIDLDQVEAAALILALARELARASGAPKMWRRARLNGVKRHVQRMVDYLTEGDPAFWAYQAERGHRKAATS